MGSEDARTHLELVVLPLWLAHGIYEEVSGLFTCLDNRGRQRGIPDKFTWCQGRFVCYLPGRLLGGRRLLDSDAEQCLVWAQRGAQFLRNVRWVKPSTSVTREA